MNKVIFALTLLFVSQIQGQENYRLPTNELPVTYLKGLKVDNTSRKLSEKERVDLVSLFVKSHVNSVRKYKQDYLIETDTPIYQLLKANFPGVAEREGEGGVFLGQIVRYFNRFPEYKSTVELGLREALQEKKRCRG